MSMNFSHTFCRASLLLTSVLALSAPLAEAQASSYYQKISIDMVLRTKPAVVYVSPKYQVTLVVSGREVTGVSLELSKQKLFSVTLADNHRMIFLDTLTNKGGADLNLILDDETILPIHLMVNDVPSGTRIYTFTDTDDSSPEMATPVQPAAPAPAPQSPAPPTSKNSAPASAPAPQTTQVPSALPQSSAFGLSARPQPPKPLVQMTVKATKNQGGVNLALALTSPAGKAIRADLANLKISDGKNVLPYTIEKPARGLLLPVMTTVRVNAASQQMYVQWPVTSIFPSNQYFLTTTVTVN